MDWVKQASLKSLAILVTLLLLAVALSPQTVWGLGAWDIYRVKFGHVLARGMVLDDNGFPTYVEYDDTGSRVGGWSQPLALAEGAFVMPAEQVRTTLTLIDELQGEYNNKLLILSREAYTAGEFKSRFGEPVGKLDLSPIYKSVVVKPAEAVKDAFDSHVLLLSRFDLNAAPAISDTARSALFDAAGSLIYASDNNIAFESAFFDGPDGEGNRPPVFERLNDYKAYAPFSGAEIEPWIDGAALSEKDGKFVASYNIVPCPGFTFFYDNVPLIMTYRYAGFTANGVRPLMDAQIYPGSDFCSGIEEAIQPTNLVAAMTKVAIIGINAASSTPIYPTNFYVDTGFISGIAKLAPIGAKTSYVYKKPDLNPIAMQNVDFDGDRIYDKVILGGMKDGKFFCQADTKSAEYQGVFLSSRGQEALSLDCSDEKPEASQPDIIRLADHKGDFGPQGLVGEISIEDLKDTDIMVFRESTGMLITHRKGLNGNELPVNSSFYGTEGDAFIFQMMIRGPVGNPFSILGKGIGEAGFNKFQSAANMNPALHARNSDHLKPGEALRLVLINRKTGYIGTKRTHYVQGYSGGMVQFALNNIQMVPPNLKISAERRFTIKEGLSASSETHTQLIGYEGSAMGDDEMLTITTEWFDHDGSPLPEGLSDYGYTGRLAKVAGPGVLVASGGEMANFAIRPGKQLQQIRLADMANAADHFYVQVNGKPKHENPSFADGGAAESGPMAQRPSHYVPFKVPLIDEAKTRENEYLYGKLKDEGKDEGLEKPEPVYRWVYRPELQFSSYDLKVKDIIRRQSEGQTSSLFDKEVPLIGTNDSAVKLLYTLIESDQQALEFLGAGQELVFALGATELKAKMGEGNQLIFENLDHIASLDVEDFVTLSLYNNTDPYNVLWEYAFETIAVDTRWIGYKDIGEDGTIYVSADNPVVPVQAALLGYENRENKKPIIVKWAAKGQGVVEGVDLSARESGVFPADIRMMQIAGSRAYPEAYIDDPDNVVKLGAIEVVAGEPANVHIEMDGEAFIEGHKGIHVTVGAWDAYGNAVRDDTPVIFSLDGNAVFSTKDVSIKDGQARAFIQGVSLPDDEAKITVKVGEVITSKDFVVQPLRVAITDYPLQLEPRKVYPVTVKVTEPGGGAVTGVSVILSANAGRFNSATLETDSEGKVVGQFFSGFSSIEDFKFSARVGLINAVFEQADIKPGSDTYNNTAKTIVIGDETANGFAEYERYDGARIGLAYKTEANILVHGKPNETINLKLGTLAEPNLQPIAAYLMNDLLGETVDEENGLYKGQAKHIVLVDGDATGTGKSFRFNREAFLNPADIWESSQVIVPLNPAFSPQNSIGFRVDLNATDLSGGDIFTLQGGAQGLSIQPDGSLKYHVYTMDGRFEVTSAPITNEKWHTVAGRYKNGYLELEIDGISSRVAASGQLSYSISERGLSLGQGFNGRLSRFNLYDWDSAALMTFEDGATSKTFTFAQNQSEDAIKVVSAGQLNQLGQNAQSLRIGLDSGTTVDFVSVISKEYYGILTSIYIEIAKPEGYPPIAANGELYQQYQGLPIFPMAHAGLIDWLYENAYEVAMEVIGVFIPFNDFKILAQQLYYLGKGDSRFDGFEFTLSSIAVLSVVPVAKALKPLSAALRRVLEPLKGNIGKFVKAVGGVLGKVIDQALDGRYDTLLNSLPFLIIAAEMASDDEAREGLILIFNSIASADDLLAWMDYLSLPAEPWEGDEVPPVIDEEGNTTSALTDVNQIYPWGDLPLIGAAYAKSKFSARRIAGLIMGKALAKLKNQLPELLDDPQLMSKAVKEITNAAKKGELRPYIFKDNILKAAVKLINKSKVWLTELITGHPDQRIAPGLILASIVFLEEQMANGQLFSSQTSEDSDSQIEVRELYARLLLKGKDQFAEAKYHGAGFHLMMLVYYQLRSKIDGEPKVLAIEAKRPISIGKFIYNREVDIVLSLPPANDGIANEKWVELKSFKAPLNKGLFKVWAFNTAVKTGQHLHKEYFSDFVRSKKEIKNTDKYTMTPTWRFHDFKTHPPKKAKGESAKVQSGPDAAAIKGVKDELCATPTGTPERVIQDYTGDLSNSKLRALCEAEYGGVTALHNEWSILQEFKDNALFDDIRELMEGAANVN